MASSFVNLIKYSVRKVEVEDQMKNKMLSTY